MATIVLDPGHGGHQTIPNDSTWNNAVGPEGTLEKNLTLKVGLKAFQFLSQMGHDVRMTRTSDVNLRLRDRAKVARDARAKAFVSIHFNGSRAHNAQGTETLVHTNYSPQSAKLSLRVQDALLQATRLSDRNRSFDPATRIKPQALGVLRPDRHYPSTAACLAEVSFLDRADEEQRLWDDDYIESIARALAKGIVDYTGEGIQVVPPDAGDAIEAEAAANPDSPSPENFLGITHSPPPMDNVPAKGTADAAEISAIPAGAFSPAFVGASGPPMALLAGQPEWPSLDTFISFIDGLNLSHFTADEFLFMGASNSGSCRGLNSYPPLNLWPNIAKTALMLDTIRKEMGTSIRILSCYRSPEYNNCVGGEKRSLHMEFNAIDFTCSAGTPEIWRRVAIRLRNSDKRFLGGIGVYPRSNFVHIDTRGRAADWIGN